jgi:hypothetical protein
MKIAIMQPYFFPYLGYFDLLHNVDLFIVYDTVQYIKQGWINRNRILHPDKSGWQYIIVPTVSASFRDSYRTSILDIKVANNKPWQKRILGQLAHYKKFAPYANETIEFVQGCLSSNESSLSRLNVDVLQNCVKYLNLDFNYSICSEMDIDLDLKRDPEERVLDICKFSGANEYINLPGGTELYHSEVFETQKITLGFRKIPPLVYSTGPYKFEENLSIIDLLMWNKPEIIKKHLEEYRMAPYGKI